MSDEFDPEKLQAGVDDSQIVLESAARVLERAVIKEQDAIKANDQKKAELEKLLDTYQVGSDVSRIKLLASEWKETQRVVVEAGVARLRAHSEHEQALVYWNAAQRLLGDGKKD